MSALTAGSALSAVWADAVLTASTATPTGGPDPDLVTPGTIGFLTTFGIVVVAIFLIRDALKRVRRVRARSRASDAYPIPLRKYAVPNQSKLSGGTPPKSAVESPESAEPAEVGADDVEGDERAQGRDGEPAGDGRG